MKVVGAGFGRTGTASLKEALETLGFGPCYHMTEVFAHPDHADFWLAAWRSEPADWEGVLGRYEAALDWPACTFYEELMERSPDAKVILTVRDPERWYESVRNTIYELSVVIPRAPLSRAIYALIGAFVPAARVGPRMTGEIIWQGTFDGLFEDKHQAIRVFERHNKEVKRKVPPEKLLVYEVREGWAPLCDFLGVEEPDDPFPHANDTAEMRRRILGIRATSVAVPATLALLAGGLYLALSRRNSAR